MKIKTGQTVYELVESVNPVNNSPVSATTFNTVFFINGSPISTISPTINLTNVSAATFSVSWSAHTTGYHQIYMKNNITNVIYLSDIYNVLPDNEIDPTPTIYVGL